MEKALWSQMEYSPMVYSPNGKGMVLWKITFGSANRHGKRLKKYSIKKYDANQN